MSKRVRTAGSEPATGPRRGGDAPTLPDRQPPITHTMEVPADGEPDWLVLPAGPGVAVFEGADGRTVLIATTANLRELARRRLGHAPPEEPGSKSRWVDHRSVTARVLGVWCGSAFECDAVYLRLARERLPAVYRAAVERWRGWFVHVDAGAAFPEFSKTNLTGLVKPRSASGLVGDEQPPGPLSGVLLGPVPDKDAAGRLIERVIDAFDLCRFHNLLTMAPRASACAYKEMGRCPAPCDGSETMESYRARVGAAAGCVSGLASARGLLETRMREAAAAHEFEAAAALHAQLKRLGGLEHPSFAHVRPLEAFKWLVVQASPKPGWARVFAVVGGRMAWMCDATEEGAAEVAARVGELYRGPAPFGFTAPEIDTVGLMCRWLFVPKAKRAGEFVAIGEGVEEGVVRAAVRAVVKRKKGEEVAEVEMESFEPPGASLPPGRADS